MFLLDFQLAAESDAEVSQFDSLENCSDGGMSAENFNTLKKVPLAPIDPPPEFQVSFTLVLYICSSIERLLIGFSKLFVFSKGFSTNDATTIDGTSKFFNEIGEKYCVNGNDRHEFQFNL